MTRIHACLMADPFTSLKVPLRFGTVALGYFQLFSWKCANAVCKSIGRCSTTPNYLIKSRYVLSRIGKLLLCTTAETPIINVIRNGNSIWIFVYRNGCRNSHGIRFMNGNNFWYFKRSQSGHVWGFSFTCGVMWKVCANVKVLFFRTLEVYFSF